MSIEFYNYPSADVQRELVDRNEKCLICLEPFDAAKPIVAHDCSEKVKHVFDKTCMTNWIHEHESCPLCKEKISPDSVKQVFGIESKIENVEEGSFIPIMTSDGGDLVSHNTGTLTDKQVLASLVVAGIGVGAGYAATQLATSVGYDKETAIKFGLGVGATVFAVTNFAARKFRSFFI